MKKLITILAIMLVVVGAVFAEDPQPTNQRLTLQSDVSEKKPAFKFQGSEDDKYGTDGKVVTSAQGSWDGTLITSAKSIADADITLNFRILQTGSAGESDSTTYARYKGVVTFAVEVGDLTQQAPLAANTSAATVEGTLGTLTVGTVGKYDASVNGSTTEVSNKITLSTTSNGFSAAYNGKVKDDQVIGTFSATWKKDETLPNGTYKADITLTISAV